MLRRTAQRRIRKDMSQFEKFVAEGSEKADELAKAGANVGRRIYGGSDGKDSPARTRRGVCSSAVRGQLSLLSRTMVKPKPKEKWIFVDQKGEKTNHRTEWACGIRIGIDVCQENAKKTWKIGVTWSEEWTGKERS